MLLDLKWDGELDGECGGELCADESWRCLGRQSVGAFVHFLVCQVADDVPAYKVCDNGGNVKIIHHNWPFLVATPWGEPMPLGASKSLSEEGTTRPALVELTPLEWESKVPESIVDKAAIPCLTSRILLGWVDGILWLLSTVAQRPTLRGLGAGDGMWSLSDEKVH